MGEILEHTREMGPYSVEARRESFYLNRACHDAEPDRAGAWPTSGNESGMSAVVRVPAADIPALTHALRAVAAQPACRPSEPESAEAGGARWRVRRVEDSRMLEIEGPWVMVSEEDRRDLPKPGIDYLIGTEILYADVKGLLTLTCEIAQSFAA